MALKQYTHNKHGPRQIVLNALRLRRALGVCLNSVAIYTGRAGQRNKRKTFLSKTFYTSLIVAYCVYLKRNDMVEHMCCVTHQRILKINKHSANVIKLEPRKFSVSPKEIKLNTQRERPDNQCRN